MGCGLLPTSLIALEGLYRVCFNKQAVLDLVLYISLRYVDMYTTPSFLFTNSLVSFLTHSLTHFLPPYLLLLSIFYLFTGVTWAMAVKSSSTFYCSKTVLFSHHWFVTANRDTWNETGENIFDKIQLDTPLIYWIHFVIIGESSAAHSSWHQNTSRFSVTLTKTTLRENWTPFSQSSWEINKIC